MSHNAYEEVYSQLTQSSGPVLPVYVYANSEEVLDYTKQNGTNDHIMDAWVDTMKTFQVGGNIGFVALSRFKHEENDHNYPEVTGSNYNDYDGAFDEWMKDENKNGWGDLTQFQGAHLFIHGNGCTVEHASASSGGDDAANNAFNRSIQAWTGVGCGDDMNEFEVASAIQEPLHTFINYNNSTVQDELNNPDEDGNLPEHGLGEINNGAITPLLTYHADEGYADMGNCDETGSTNSWTAELTECTLTAVNATAKEA